MPTVVKQVAEKRIVNILRIQHIIPAKLLSPFHNVEVHLNEHGWPIRFLKLLVSVDKLNNPIRVTLRTPT